MARARGKDLGKSISFRSLVMLRAEKFVFSLFNKDEKIKIILRAASNSTHPSL